MTPSPPEQNVHAESRLGIQFWAALFVVYCLFVAFSLLRVPIPGVNEPHYLCKAKHFWQPLWCDQDSFLTSSNPHFVFYVTFGWLTTFLSLNTTAIVGRCIGLIPLAVGWNLLSFKLTHRVWVSTVSLSIFFVLQSAGNWSGEWLVGGIESKVVAYGFLFWSIAQAMSLKLPSSALLAGLAVSFHPVIGVWGTLAAAIATALFVIISDKRVQLIRLVSLQTWGFSIALFLLAATPGLISAGSAVLEGDAEATRIATNLQVSHRLAHHLDPMKFPREAYRYFVMMTLGWLVLLPNALDKQRGRWWHLIVGISLLIALSGVLIGWGPRPMKEMSGYEWRMNVLKFYPFRLADLLVPIALSIVAASKLTSWTASQIKGKTPQLIAWIVMAMALTWIGLSVPGSEQNPSKMSEDKHQNWVNACQWIETNTAEDELIYSFDNQWAVKWFAQRSEYVNYKDCPQDAKSIIEWNRRRWVIARWKKEAFQDGSISIDELQDLSKRTNTSTFICDRLGPIEREPDYQNSDFRIYRVNVPPQ